MTGPRLSRRRAAVAGATVLAALIPIASSARGVDTSALDGVSVRQLQNQVQLPQTPDASVPVPQVPQVSTPSVPSVTTPSVPSVPSVPQVSTPSVPSVSTPQVRVPSVGTPSTSSGGSSTSGGSGGGGGSGGSSSGSNASSGSPSPGTPAASATAGRSGSAAARPAARRSVGSSPQARARRRAAHERHLRSEVRTFQRCLGSLNGLDRRYLTLRAGLDGPPLSRAQTARELGISSSDARVIERHGLRQLRFACGGGSSTAGHTIAAIAPRMARLLPASLLMATGGALTQLVDQSRLSGQHGVKGAHASSPESDGPGTMRASVSRPLASASSEGIGAVWIAIVAALALMTAVALTTLRRRTAPAAPAAPRRVSNVSAALSLPPAPLPPAPPLPLPPRDEALVPPPPPPGPDADAEAQPQAPALTPAAPPPAPARGRDYRRAAMLASGVISVAARELMRRRRRH